MARQFIFKDTETGRELVLPVTPGSYDIEHGRKAAGITMQESGDVNLPGPAVLLDTELTCLLPAQGYPFNQPGVESYKKNMFALLGKPGYEGLTAELEAKLK